MRLRAKPTRCPRCLEWILSGPDGDVAALHARLELPRLSPWGEAMARGTGRRTYQVTRDGRIWRRIDDQQITANSALAVWVHAEHKCADPVPAEWIAPINVPPKADSDECPF